MKKRKKSLDNIIILHKCTINDNHMMYGSWYMKRDGQNFLSFWTVFCPFTPPNSLKSQNFKKLKKTPGRDHHFTQVYQKSWSYAKLFLRYGVWQIKFYFSFWAIFCPFTPLTVQKIKISLKWKTRLEISSFYICVPKVMIR